MKHFIAILFLTVFYYTGFLNSQSNISSLITDKLTDEGFKNVSVGGENKELTVFYENSIYRSDIIGLASVLQIIDSNINEESVINLVLLKEAIPVVYVSITSENLRLMISSKTKVDFSTGYNVSKFLKKYEVGERQNSSQYFTDLIVGPDIGLQLGNYDSPFNFQINLHPELNTYLWKGSRLGVKVNLPLVEKKFVDKYNYIRPESVSLEQFFRVSNAVFGRFSIGMFNNQRYGFDFETAAWLLNGRILLNGNIGYTGYMAYLKEGTSGIYSDVYEVNVLEKSKLNSFQYFVDLEYRYSPYDLAIKVGYGEYLYHNKAFSLEVLRNFDDFLLGLRGYSGSTGNTLEGRLIIPLTPKKYLNKQRFRVRMANHFDYSHTVGSAYYRTYNSGLTIDRCLWEINPQYIKNNLHKSFN